MQRAGTGNSRGSQLGHAEAEQADGLAICHEDLPERLAGESVIVQLLDWKDHSHILTEQLDITQI